MNVATIHQGEGRDEPGVEAKVVRIQVQLQFPYTQGTQYGFNGSCLKRPSLAFFLFLGLVLLLPCLKWIDSKWNEKEPRPDVKKRSGGNQPDPDYSRQGKHISVSGGIGIQDDRDQQQPEQEKQYQGYEDVPKHTSKVGSGSFVFQRKSVSIIKLSVNK